MNKTWLKKSAGILTLAALTTGSVCPAFADIAYSKNPEYTKIIIIDGNNEEAAVFNWEYDKEKMLCDYNSDYRERINKIIESVNEKISNSLTERKAGIQESINTEEKSDDNDYSLNKDNITADNSGLEQSYSEYVTKVIELTNAERAKCNLLPLKLSEALCKSAQDHCDDMYEKNYFDHTSPDGKTMSDRIEKYSSAYGYKGENIAWGYDTPEAVVNGWMNSEGHRSNILNKNYTDIGIGYNNGYWVQNFGG